MSEVVHSTVDLVVVEEENQRPERKNQYLAAASASMCAMAVGAAIGYSSPANASFRCDHNNNNNNNDTMTTTTTPSYSNNNNNNSCSEWWYLNETDRGVAQNLTMLIIGRVLGGLTTGISSLVVPTYTTEYASKDIRGALGSGFQLFLTAGILYAYVSGVGGGVLALADIGVCCVGCNLPVTGGVPQRVSQLPHGQRKGDRG
ncbi:hypothetical protein Pmani_024851 [Petrolisthes manimaculis]|uniref:Major facilitator superfamily (MFS) profile domain-containing protein n=1 Tax=Petrolisthes manimaculis TaxID=1843537 RepID=A0AAE1TYX8_9EUCA|nr:hypothetical protein Pmani_024851 [Petrolisthes manimaculis]